MESDIYKQFYEFEKDHWWSKGMRYLCNSMIARYHGIKTGDYILDIGCGTGEMTRSLGDIGVTFGADCSSEAIDFCKKRGIDRLVRTTAEDAAFKDSSFSVVVAFCMIEHIEDDKLFLKRMNSILKHGGYLIVLTSAFQFLWSAHDDLAHHKRRYTACQVGRIMRESGFRVNKLSYVNCILFLPILIVRLFQRCFNIQPKLEKRFLLDIVKIPNFINNALYLLLKVETILLNYIDFPFGVGIIGIGQKE